MILGILKGAAIGAGVGYAAFTLGLMGGMHWFTYGVVGFLVGFLVGKPFWVHMAERGSTIWTPIIKGIVGVGIAAGIYAIVAKAWGGFDLEIANESRIIYDWQYIMGGVIGSIYGAFVEIDDAAPASKPKSDKD